MAIEVGRNNQVDSNFGKLTTARKLLFCLNERSSARVERTTTSYDKFYCLVGAPDEIRDPESFMKWISHQIAEGENSDNRRITSSFSEYFEDFSQWFNSLTWYAMVQRDIRIGKKSFCAQEFVKDIYSDVPDKASVLDKVGIDIDRAKKGDAAFWKEVESRLLEYREIVHDVSKEIMVPTHRKLGIFVENQLRRVLR